MGHPLAQQLEGADLRQNLGLLVAEARRPSAPLEPLLSWLASRDPALLAELCCGPQSPGGPALCRAALSQIALLERVLTPRGALSRLADLAGDIAAAEEILAAAARRYPEAPWLIALSRRIEGDRAGRIHLLSAADLPILPALCLSYAELGLAAGLAAAAIEGGHPAPLAALLGLDPAAALPVIREFEARWPSVDALPWLVEQWGPDVEALTAALGRPLREPLTMAKLHSGGGALS